MNDDDRREVMHSLVAHRARTRNLPDTDPETRTELLARGKELFEEAVRGMPPGRSWEDEDQWVRTMWACEAAIERGLL